MNLHSIRVKSTVPMVLLAFTLVVVVAMFSYLSAMQKSALDAQAVKFNLDFVRDLQNTNAAGELLTLELRRSGAVRTLTVGAAVYALTPVSGTAVLTTAAGRRLWRCSMPSN